MKFYVSAFVGVIIKVKQETINNANGSGRGLIFCITQGFFPERLKKIAEKFSEVPCIREQVRKPDLQITKQ